MFLKSCARVLFLLILSTVIISAQEYPPAGVPAPNPDENAIGSLGVQLITQFLTGDFVRRKIQVLFDLIDLKARLIYAVTSFFTPENLIALKRFLDWICRFATFLNQFLPNIPEDDNPKTALLGLILNVFNGFASTGGIDMPPAVYGPPQVYGVPPITEAPPTSYGVPPKIEPTQFTSQVLPTSTAASVNVAVNVKRSAKPHPEPEPVKAHVTETKLSELSEDDVRRMLKNNEGIVTLSRLISATRR